jgi:hypothetical protein
MPIFIKASDVISKNEEAVVVFTHGRHFFYDPSGSGSTGNWVVDRENLEYVDKVIIYLRQDGESINRIYLGNYAGNRKSPEPGRTTIRFSKLQEVCTTESTWFEFASNGQNPVVYISN